MSRRAEVAGGRAGRTIAWPIFALVIVSVIVGTLVVFVVTFSGPPPRGQPGDGATVAAILRTGKVPGGDKPALAFHIADAPPAPTRPFHADPAARDRLAAALGTDLGRVRAYTMRPNGPLHEGGPRGGPSPRFGPSAFDDPSDFGRDFVLAWQVPGGWRIVETPRPLLAPWHFKTLTAMLIAILVLALPAWVIARAISRPVRQIASAAQEARAGMALPPLPVGGSREVRDLSRSVAAMHARLAAHAEGRTTMLAAIAHDLGTPLSRLAFRVEQLPEAARDRAATDIAEMREMIAAALSFARDEHADVSVRVELGSLLDSLVEDMRDAGAAVTLAAGPRAVVRGDSGGLRRLFANLIDNAIRYGDRADVAWQVADGVVTVTVDDRGPGVDPATAETLFEPFVRGDPSRNRSTGGTGLGLAIVRSIATRHRSEVSLGPGPAGARARVVLPLA